MAQVNDLSTLPVCYESIIFSLPFLNGGGPSVRFGELAMPGDPNPDGSRLSSFLDSLPGGEPRLEKDCACVLGEGLPGAEVLEREGAGDNPDAASVRRNSTQRREKDY